MIARLFYVWLLCVVGLAVVLVAVGVRELCRTRRRASRHRARVARWQFQ